VGLYRDGFRVQPFGDSTFDWLNLDSRRVNNPSLRVSNNQVSGFVFITADANPELRDRSHREGLIETGAFDDLKATVVAVLSELETRRKQKRERPDRERSLGTGIFGRFDVTRLRALAEARPDDPELVAAISEVTQQIESGVTEVKQTIARFSKLATLGSLIDIVLHEGRTPLSRIRSGIAGILGRVPAAQALSADERVAKYGSRVEAGAQLLSSLFDRIEPLSGRRRATAEVVDTDVLLDQTLELLAPRLASYKVAVERVGASTSLLAQPGEVVQVLLNIIDNAIYWLAQVDKDKRRIRISSSPTPDGWLVYISDSGPGVSSSFSQEIFDAYFSTKPDGVGLGLAIAGSTIQDFYNGELELVAPDQLGGANFRLLFRSRIG
jgi:C4-dicarboxylate-specific signal transduction histidine kinase